MHSDLLIPWHTEISKISDLKRREVVSTIHHDALVAVAAFKKAEHHVLEIIAHADQHRVFLDLGYSSLYAWCIEGLRMSPSQASNVIVVARKSTEIPALKRVIESGALGISKARKMTSVMTSENQSEWITKAITMTEKQPVPLRFNSCPFGVEI